MPGNGEIRYQMNEWGAEGIPFLFIIDFEQHKPLIFRLDEIDPAQLLYNVNGVTNSYQGNILQVIPQLRKHPEAFNEYLKKFNKVKNEISLGNSYLLNLTCNTPIELNLTLKEVFLHCVSKYRLWLNDRFVCFSPEIFVIIGNGIIRSFPMKGTIDASISHAETVILNDPKETAEHCTIVDLIRNDLSVVSKQVRVVRFRYIETIVAQDKKLLQVSSEICGDLEENYLSHLGDIIYALLPAGSVSGAPKRKTKEIIAAVEGRIRGYYTGIFGIFDGSKLDSGVMIRFIENDGYGYRYFSGGGITSLSDPESEYREMIDKIYVPLV
jgi:para-aminobenzoate synthetase component 1